MKRIIESLVDPADHLALDEATLLLADAGEMGESIRIWEFANDVVVVGRSTKVNDEIQIDFCRDRKIPIMRRCSGGASIVAGPGCLMYSVVVNLNRHGDLRKIDAAHTFVMSRVLNAVKPQIPEVALQGTCDLTYQDRKFSGNSLRISRTHLLYHGTILYASDLGLLANCLATAPRQPEYRGGRKHDDFVSNVPIDPEAFTQQLLVEFEVADSVITDAITDLPDTEIQRLRQLRYDNPKWHLRH
ncbi:MAG: lipoate--protein ligase family protein [Pirellulaceae bacterium]